LKAVPAHTFSAGSPSEGLEEATSTTTTCGDHSEEGSVSEVRLPAATQQVWGTNCAACATPRGATFRLGRCASCRMRRVLSTRAFCCVFRMPDTVAVAARPALTARKARCHRPRPWPPTRRRRRSFCLLPAGQRQPREKEKPTRGEQRPNRRPNRRPRTTVMASRRRPPTARRQGKITSRIVPSLGPWPNPKSAPLLSFFASGGCCA